MNFPRVIRLDDSDERIYAALSRPGEWAVPGAFAFLNVDLENADGKTLQAFHNGFLGVDSFGWTTLVQVDEISNAEYAQVIERLAVHFVMRYNAPDLDVATKAAQEEVEFAASICDHPVNTLLAVKRSLGEEGIEENFRVVQPPGGIDHENLKLWSIVDDDKS